MTTVEHPLYQYRFVMPDGTQKIASTWGKDLMPDKDGIIRDAVFGYWRPGAFTVLTTLTFDRGGARIDGLTEIECIPSIRMIPGPHVAFERFAAIAAADEKRDRDAREVAFADQDTRDALFWSAMKVEGGSHHAQDECSIRKMLDERQTIDFGILERLTGTVPKPMARLSFSDGLTITFSGISVERSMTFDPDAARDLDRVAHAWMVFTRAIREEADLDDLFAGARAA